MFGNSREERVRSDVRGDTAALGVERHVKGGTAGGFVRVDRERRGGPAA
jgi:hypothetical protein